MIDTPWTVTCYCAPGVEWDRRTVATRAKAEELAVEWFRRPIVEMVNVHRAVKGADDCDDCDNCGEGLGPLDDGRPTCQECRSDPEYRSPSARVRGIAFR